MSNTPTPTPPPEHVVGSTAAAGQTTDEERGRIFPCPSCGADLEFSIGAQSLKCPYCGHIVELQLDPDKQVEEQDFHAMLEQLRTWREEGQTDDVQASEVRCESCGANIVFHDTQTSLDCPYCASPIQREKIHDAEHRVPVDGVIPFLVERRRAAGNLRRWVQSRWFAPSDFRQQGARGKFSGVYIPFWTYDTMTANRYSGERGEDYTVTVGTGKNRRTETRTRWYPAEGAFQEFFDDVMVLAARGLPSGILQQLEPWPIGKLVPFNQQMLAGYFARTYEVKLDEGFAQAKSRIDSAIHHSTCRHIGGDRQRVHDIQTRYNAITYKHLLLPVWLMAYRYRERTYQVVINAATGEVQGERPYSFAKILFAILGVLAGFGLLWAAGGGLAFLTR